MKKLIHKILKESEDEFDSYFGETSPAEEFVYNKMIECEPKKIGKTPSGYMVNWTKYVNKKNGEVLFVDNIDTAWQSSMLYFDDNKIYQKLVEFGLNYEESKKLCIDMLYATHKRRVDKAQFLHTNRYPELYKNY